MKKLLALILAMMMLVLAGCGGDKVPETQENKANSEVAHITAFKNYLKAVEECDSDSLFDLLPARDIDEVLYNNSFHVEYLDDYLADTVGGFTKKFGEFYYEIKDVDEHEFDKGELEDYEEYYDELVDFYEGFDAPKIEAGYKIKCKLVLKGEKNEKDGKCTVIMIKEDGKWIVWSLATSVPCANIDEI